MNKEELTRRAEEEVAKELGFNLTKIDQRNTEMKPVHILKDGVGLRPASNEETDLWLFAVRLMRFQLQVREAEKEMEKLVIKASPPTTYAHDEGWNAAIGECQSILTKHTQEGQ